MSISVVINMPRRPLPWEYDDGGRSAAGYRGDAGDCVVRSLAIATETPYQEVYDDLRQRIGGTPRDGVAKKHAGAYLTERGYEWVAKMSIGSGCTTHLAVGELPAGRLVCRLSRHLVAVVDGVVRDTYDPTRDGTRCVYGYWIAP